MTASILFGLTILFPILDRASSFALEPLNEQKDGDNLESAYDIDDVNSTVRDLVIETVVETLKKHAALSTSNESPRKKEHMFQNARRIDRSEEYPKAAINIDILNRRKMKKGGNNEDANILRVLGGSEAQINDFPYTVSIVVRDEHWCNGAIITPYFVITAAHCTNFVLPVANDPVILGKRLKVRSGSSTNSGGMLTSVKSVIRHPFFEVQPPPHFDVALLELETDLEISATETTGSTAKIQISDDVMSPFPQSFVTVAGWGATKPSSNARSANLQSARLKTRTQDYCIDSYQDVAGLYINENFVCASLLRNKTIKRDLCIFDGGAPAVQRNKLLAIMSFGPENCGDGQPLVFVRLPQLLPWITKEVEKFESARSAKAFIG